MCTGTTSRSLVPKLRLPSRGKISLVPKLQLGNGARYCPPLEDGDGRRADDPEGEQAPKGPNMIAQGAALG